MPFSFPVTAPELDVAVVGAGPVGTTLALLLDRFGVRCEVLEARAEPFPLPRAVHLDDEALRTLELVGVAADVPVRPIDGMSLVDARLRHLASIDRVGRPLGRPQSVLMHQPDLERALWSKAGRLVRVGQRVDQVAQGDSGVTLGVEGGDAVTARWVVACDGANSRVRALAGFGMGAGRFRQRWLVVDLLGEPGASHPPRVLQVCDPARPATSVPVGGGRHRLEARAHGDEPDAALLERASEIVGPLARRLGVGGNTVERAAVYEFRGRVARTFQRGRVLLAGDAAHQMPPFLGQGLCAGLRDAANLAWKLAYVVSGRAEAALLDSYTAERRPHARLAVRLTGALGRVIADRRRATGTLRDGLLRVGDRALPMARLGTIEVPRLPHGPLVEREGGRPLPWELERRLEPHLGGFVVAGAGAPAGEGLPLALRRWWERLGAALVDLPESAADRRPGLIVVRPDGLVLGRYPVAGSAGISPLADLAARLSGAGLRGLSDRGRAA